MSIVLILTVILVVILLIYYLSKPRDIPQKPQPQPKLRGLPPVREVQVFLDDTTPQMVQVRTRKDLEDEIERAVDRLTAPVDYNQQQVIETEQRVIDAQKQKVEQLQLEAEQEAAAREAEMAAKKKRSDDMIKQRREELFMKRRKMQEERAAKLLLEREKERLKKEKQLAELKLARQKAQQELEVAQKAQSDREKRLKEEELRLLEEARQKVEEDKIKVEAEAAELQKKVEMEEAEAQADEAKFKQQMEEAKAEQARMEEEYEAKKAEQALKAEEANAELNELLESEKERQAQMDADDERLRQEETQRLLDANEEALRELEEAEAEQARMDAELEAAEAAMSDTIQQQQQKQIDARDAVVAQGEQDELAALAAQELLQRTSEQTGDAEQQVERDAALLLEQTSERDWDTLTAEEQQAALDAQAQLDTDSYAAVPDYGENPAMLFDYAAYERGDPIDCVPDEWSDWKKVGGLQEESKTITEGQGPWTRTYEKKTGRWKQGWQRTREPIINAMNGGKGCPLTETKYTTQPSIDCGEEDWNEWTNVGAPYKEGPSNRVKWYQNQKRTRATEVVPDGCNLREDTKKNELSPINCVWGEWGDWTVSGRYEEKEWRGQGGPFGDRRFVPSGKWVEDHTRTRPKIVQDRYGGKCKDVGIEKITKPAGAKDCVTGEWTSWQNATDGRGTPREATEERTTRGGTTVKKLGYWKVYQQRTRPVLEGAQNGGACKWIEFRDHTLPKQNCVQSAWSGWVHQRRWNSGNNWYDRQKRTRSTITPAAYGGTGCGATSEERDVGVPKVHCATSGWSGWTNGYKADVWRNSYTCEQRGPWNRVCGNIGPTRVYRQDKRTRSITRHPAWGGNGCGALEETRETMRTPINCTVSGWSCSGRNCTRSITRHPAWGGSACPSLSYTKPAPPVRPPTRAGK